MGEGRGLPMVRIVFKAAARFLGRMRGRRLAVLVAISFGLVLFAFIGVPWLVSTVGLESLHAH